MSTTTGGGAIGPLNIVVNVGILSFVSDADRERGLKPDFTVNAHFSMELGDEWTVQLDYSKLKYLDVELSTSSVAKKLATTPFPLIDKHLYHIFRECCAQRNSTYDSQQQIFIANFITGKLERWIQMLIQRFHSFPRDIKHLLNRAFGIFPLNQIGNMTSGGGSDAFTTNASDGGSSSNNGNNNGGSGGGDGGGGGFFNSMFRPKSAPSSPLTSDNIQNVATGSNVKHHRADDTGSVGSGKSGSSASSALKKMMNFGSDRNVANINGVGERRISSAFDAEDILIAQKPPLAIAVKRGTKDEGRHNRVHYEISIHCDLVGPDGKLVFTPLIVQKRYNDFKQLWKDLQEKNVYNLDRIHTCDATNYKNYLFLLSKFPLPPMTLRNGFGSSLSEEELQSRSRHLDMWIREVCFSFYLMPNPDAKNLVKRFFNFRPKIATDRDTVFLHQFTNGIVEGSRADIAALRILNFKTGSLHSGGSVHSEKQSDKGQIAPTKITGAPPTALNRLASNKSTGKASSVSSAQSNNDTISEYGAPSVTGSEIAVYTGKDHLGRKDQDTTVYYNHHEVINRTDVFKTLQVGSIKFIVCNSRSTWTFPYFLAFDHKRFNDQSIWTRFGEMIFSSEIVDKLRSLEQKASSIGQENSSNSANLGNNDKKSAGRRGSGFGGGGGGAKSLTVDPYQSLTPIEERDSKVDFDAEPSERSGSDGSLEDAKEIARRELNYRYLNIGMK